jgi:hypothetical protein
LAAPPANDNLADAINIITFPFSHSVTAAQRADATDETGEAVCISALKAWWYKYTPTGNGDLTITANGVGDDVDVRLGVYTGTAHPLNEVSCTDDDDGNAGFIDDLGETETIAVVAGTTYYIRVGSNDTFSGTACETTVTSTAGNGTPDGTPIPASLFNFDQPTVTYSKEIVNE